MRKRERHGLRQTNEYMIWNNMIQRCANPRASGYPRYGGAGVTVCPQWAASFLAFYEHVGPRPSSAHSIDRIDAKRGYEPGNVRWATREEQAQNQHKTVWIEWRGERRCLSDWARTLNIPLLTLHSRLNKLGWPIERALSTPKRGRGAQGIDRAIALAEAGEP